MNQPYFQPHDPALFVTSVRSFDFDPAATCPKWMEFLDFFTRGDCDVSRTLQQWVGSVLLPEIRHEQFLWLDGKGKNGKSVFVETISEVLGRQVVANLTVEQLTGKHEIAALADKRMNIAMEFEKLTPRLESAIKRLVSNEPIAINEKLKPIYSAKLGIRALFISNSVPHVSDRSDGFWRRCLLVHCGARVAEAQKVLDLEKQLVQQEAAGIFNWILRGAVDLVRADGHIFVAKSIEAAVERQRTAMDPHRVFLQTELVQTDFEKWIPGVEVLYETYREWMRGRGHKGALSWPHFKVLLKEEFPGIQSTRRRHPTAGRCYGYEGIFWKNAIEQEESYERQVAEKLARKHATNYAADVRRDVVEELRRNRLSESRRGADAPVESDDGDDYLEQAFKDAGID
ncbi:MAG: phage/plasmid primase, P4 family [Fuerstiella sp.]